MKARIKEPRFAVGKEIPAERIYSRLQQSCGFSRAEAEENLRILCENGLCVRSSENGYTMLATPSIISDMR